MYYKEYKEHIKNMTREELIAECLSLKAEYDKSCRSWLYTESIRALTAHNLMTIQNYIEDAFKELNIKCQQLMEDYTISLKEKEQYYDKLDDEYIKEMQEKENDI